MSPLKLASGACLDLDAPDPALIDLAEIARVLEGLWRWGGRSPVRLSVAHHSVLVADRVPDCARIHALLHDAHEAYLGDIQRPVSRALACGAALHDLRRRLDAAIYAALDVPQPSPLVRAAVRLADDDQGDWEMEWLWRPVALPPVDWRAEVEALL